MTDSVNLPEIPQEELSRRVKVRRKKDHLAVSFSYVGPGGAVLVESLLKIVGVLFGLCFAADVIQGYTTGTAVAHNNLAARYMPWVYQVYSIPKVPIMAAAFGGPDDRLYGLAAAAVSFGAFFVWLILDKIVMWFDLIPKFYSAIFASGKTIKFYPDQVVIRGKKYKYAPGNQSFTLEESERVRNRVRAHRFDERSKELLFINGANKIKIAAIYGSDRASVIQNSLSHILEHFPSL